MPAYNNPSCNENVNLLQYNLSKQNTLVEKPSKITRVVGGLQLNVK